MSEAPGRATPSIAFDRTMDDVNTRCRHLTTLLDVGDLDRVEHVARSAVNVWLAGCAAYRRLVKHDEATISEVKATRQRLEAMYLQLLDVMKRAYALLAGHHSRNAVDDLWMQLVTVNKATQLQGAGETHRGHIRLTNEDSLIVEPDLGLFAVLDGMGGQKGGAVASRLARDTLLEFVRQNAGRRDYRPVLQGAIDEASATVLRARQEQPEFRYMGTTVVACLVAPPTRVGEPVRAIVGHVGDSRAYRLHDGGLDLLTHDHTMVQELIDNGTLSSQEEIDRCRVKHVLTRSLGSSYGASVDVVEVDLAPGDRLLLCSDGLHTSASADAMERVLASANAPADIAKRLIELALRGEGDDNITAVVVAVPG